MRYRIRIALALLAASVAAQEREKEQPVVRVYDLGPLTAAVRRPYFGAPLPASLAEFGLLGSSVRQDEMREGDWLDEEESGEADLVIEILQTFAGDGERTFELEPLDGGQRLFARMGESDHRMVERVLGQIRSAGDPPVEIDVRHLTIPDRSLDEATRALLLAPAKLGADQLAMLAKLDVRGGRQGGALEVALGRWGIYRAVRELRYVPDYDVEIAQAAAIADPRPSIATDGLKAAIRPLLLSDGRLVLRVVASAGDRDGAPRRFAMDGREVQDTLRLRNTDFGEVEQCDYRGGAISTDIVTATGKMAAVVLATQAGPDVRWDLLSFTVRAAPKPLVADTFAVIPVGSLVAGDPLRRLAWDGVTGELGLLGDDEPAARLQIDGLVERLAVPTEEEGEFCYLHGYLYGGCLVLRGPAARLRDATETLAMLEHELIRPAQLQIRIAVEGPGAGSRTAGFLAAPLTVGRKAVLASYLRMDTIGDYDVEIAQESRVADPSHQVVTAGTFASADLFRNLDGTYRLHLDLIVTAAPEGIRTSTARAGGVPLIQVVPLSKRIAPLRLDLSAGRPRTVDLGPDPFDAGGEGRLVATITVEPQ